MLVLLRRVVSMAMKLSTSRLFDASIVITARIDQT